ncbi:triggering receptor expressed on myeloid cells 2-like [Trichosurus vulpecula]|uniref:triggering receptor expressed on myeloid cells 2-like n=1 Tax=Trichosurus vulpecula TaxID=9337 RepID=UPI00186AED4B|nr:triggering receptor expressed on myeloid cells 2-like [Trichosurus vulpecula]
MRLLGLLILLSITEFSHTHNTTVLQAVQGQTLFISCPYDPAKYWGQLKSWCRQHEQEGHCQHVVSARRSWLIAFLKKWNGSTGIADDALAGRLTITLKDLRAHDAGLYQCQSHQDGEADILRKVMVEVLKDPLEPQSSGDSWIPEDPQILKEPQSPEDPEVQASISRSLSETRHPLSPTVFSFLVAGLLISKLLAVGFLWAIAWHKRSQKMKPESRHSHGYQLQPLPGQGEV